MFLNICLQDSWEGKKFRRKQEYLKMQTNVRKGLYKIKKGCYNDFLKWKTVNML